MAPGKRRQQQILDDSDDEAAYSPHTNSKRPRVNDSPDDDVDESMAYESDPDISALDAHMTQLVQQKMKSNEGKENPPNEYGVVTTVICENFMCHSYLIVNLGPLMNFIIGHNGSGKSAVLTALTLCLGGKASATNRGHSLKSFIKEGEDTARITVKLTNGGDGYRQDVYGDVITIERQFSLEGGSSYKLKSKSGKVISTKKEELDNITDAFALQVDNPMTILTQDSARAFLSSSSNEAKYKFFAKGVQLDQLDQDYNLVHTAIRNAEAILETKKEALEALQVRMNDAAKKLKRFEVQDGLRAKFRELQLQMAWVQVRDAKVNVENQEEIIASVKERIAKASQNKEKSEEGYETAVRSWEEAKARVAAQKAEEEPLSEHKRELTEKFLSNKADLTGLLSDQRTCRGNIQSSERKERQIEQKIREEEARLADLNGGSSVRLTEEIEAAKAEIQRLKQEKADLDQRDAALEADSREAKRSLADARQQVDSKERDVRLLHDRLETLRQGTRDELAGYNQAIRAALREIDREKGWRQKPVGPIGLHITLLDSKWLNIIERYLGGTLGGFIVTNYADGTLLKKILDRTRCHAQQFVMAPRQFNINEPDESYPTILRTLQIDHPLVRQQLIIQHSAEQTVLIQDLSEANRVMARRAPGDNIAMCFAIHQSKPGYGHKVGGAGYGSMSVTPMMPWNGASRMKSTGRDEQEEVRNQISRHEADHQKFLSNLDAEKRRVAACEAALSEHQRQKRHLRVRIQEKEEECDRLQARIEQMAVDGQLGALQESLKLAQEDRQNYQRQFDELVEQQNRINEEQESLNQQIKGVDQALGLIQKRIRDAENDEAMAKRRRDKELTDKNHWIDKVMEYETILAREEATKLELEAVVEAHTEKALQICPPREIPEGETGQSLDRKLDKMASDIRVQEASIGASKEECVAEHRQAIADFTSAKNQCEGIDLLLTFAAKVLADRRTRWEEFQQLISARARAQFMFLMSERAFNGRLRLEHAMTPPQLILEVQPGGDNSGNRGPKTLSGGEKSFSTICLLLSLWEAMGSPLRCLDEFDVYMDSVNRSISVEMMLKAAERSSGKQFILITPQNMSQASTTRCKINRIADPERGQTTVR